MRHFIRIQLLLFSRLLVAIRGRNGMMKNGVTPAFCGVLAVAFGRIAVCGSLLSITRAGAGEALYSGDDRPRRKLRSTPRCAGACCQYKTRATRGQPDLPGTAGLKTRLRAASCQPLAPGNIPKKRLPRTVPATTRTFWGAYIKPCKKQLPTVNLNIDDRVSGLTAAKTGHHHRALGSRGVHFDFYCLHGLVGTAAAGGVSSLSGYDPTIAHQTAASPHIRWRRQFCKLLAGTPLSYLNPKLQPDPDRSTPGAGDSATLNPRGTHRWLYALSLYPLRRSTISTTTTAQMVMPLPFRFAVVNEGRRAAQNL